MSASAGVEPRWGCGRPTGWWLRSEGKDSVRAPFRSAFTKGSNLTPPGEADGASAGRSHDFTRLHPVGFAVGGATGPPSPSSSEGLRFTSAGSGIMMTRILMSMESPISAPSDTCFFIAGFCAIL